MKTLKTLALIGASALAVSAVSTAAAQAQPYGYGHGYSHRYEAPRYDAARLNTAYVDRLDARVVRSAQRGIVTWPEARDLRRQLAAVRSIAINVERGRATRWDIQRLETGLNRVEAATQRYASNDRYRDWRR